jgi:membrane protease subunit (stomatin/prohibitin family)
MKIFSVIKYEGGNDALAWKFPGEDFSTLSQLIVHESQEAIFFKNGQVMDIFGAGRYTLHSENIPLLRHAVNIPFGGVSPFHCEVYFINKVTVMDILWGISDIPVQDALYKVILPVRAYGQFAVKVADSKKMLVTLVGTLHQFDEQTLKQYFKGILLTNIKNIIARQFVKENVSFLEIHSHIKEISQGIGSELVQEFEKYGIELVNFNVNEISVPENDPSYAQLKKALAKKAEMDVMGYSYQQERAFNMLDKAAANEGTGADIMSAGVGIGMGVNLGQTLGSTMTGAVSYAQSGMPMGNINSGNVDDRTLKCTKCGREISQQSSFCPYCGTETASVVQDNMVQCPSCGKIVPRGKFCASCGALMATMCPNCGRELQTGMRFCPGCGTEVK